MLDQQRPYRIHADSVASFCLHILREVAAPPGILSVVFIGSRKMREINRRFRGKDCNTDVLSFAYSGEFVDGHLFLGEIIIAPSVAWDNAEKFRKKPAAEMRRLLVHGVLHLLGYDHESDEGEMNRIQLRLLSSRAVSGHPPLAEMRRKA